MVLRLHQHNIGYTADGFYRLFTEPVIITVNKKHRSTQFRTVVNSTDWMIRHEISLQITGTVGHWDSIDNDKNTIKTL